MTEISINRYMKKFSEMFKNVKFFIFDNSNDEENILYATKELN